MTDLFDAHLLSFFRISKLCSSICIDFGAFAHFAWFWWSIFFGFIYFWVGNGIRISNKDVTVLFWDTERTNKNLIQWICGDRVSFLHGISSYLVFASVRVCLWLVFAYCIWFVLISSDYRCHLLSQNCYHSLQINAAFYSFRIHSIAPKMLFVSLLLNILRLVIDFLLFGL